MEERLLLALHGLKSLKLAEKLRILECCSGENAFANLTSSDLEELLGRRLRGRKVFPSKELKAAEGHSREARERGISWTWFGDSRYPGKLRNIYDPPLVLFWRGALPPEDLESPVLGVVGTRRPTLEADRSAFALGLDAGQAGIPLISGMALGIDGTAHRGTLAGGGKTWAVLGTGCNILYPQSHRRLAADILNKGGGLISELFPGTPPRRYNFPKRNRLISALSSHVVLVQAPGRSGALHTADFALEQGREVFVHERGLGGYKGRGTAALAEEGAGVIRNLKEIFPWISLGEHSLNEPYFFSEGGVEEAAGAASLLLHREIHDESIFYRGRVQF